MSGNGGNRKPCGNSIKFKRGGAFPVSLFENPMSGNEGNRKRYNSISGSEYIYRGIVTRYYYSQCDSKCSHSLSIDTNNIYVYIYLCTYISIGEYI